MEEGFQSITKAILKSIKGHGFVLLVGLVAGHAMGKANFSKFIAGPAKGLWVWIGSYFLGWLVLFGAYMINRLRQHACGKMKHE